MKENWKRYFLWAASFFAALILLNSLRDFYVNVGRAERETEYRDEVRQIQTAKDGVIEKKNVLIGNLVKEKLDDRKNHHKEIRIKDTEFKKYRAKITEEFQDIKMEMAKLQIKNSTLQAQLLDFQATLLSLLLNNNELAKALTETDKTMFDHYNEAMEAASRVVETKYIAYLDKIDRVKKSKKSWRMK